MSYSLAAYVVDLDVLHGSVASEDDEPRRMIEARFERRPDGFFHIGGAEAVAADADKAAPDPHVREAVESCMEWCRAADEAWHGVAGFFS
ncbi:MULTISPECIES: hypothetical protein [unclassified Nocardiopsis]|uniref:hypothetical protein n=1 Tax=Nocardiopsis TaxID=2013 RepID=UPI00387B5E7C